LNNFCFVHRFSQVQIMAQMAEEKAFVSQLPPVRAFDIQPTEQLLQRLKDLYALYNFEWIQSQVVFADSIDGDSENKKRKKRAVVKQYKTVMKAKRAFWKEVDQYLQPKYNAYNPFIKLIASGMLKAMKYEHRDQAYFKDYVRSLINEKCPSSRGQLNNEMINLFPSKMGQGSMEEHSLNHTPISAPIRLIAEGMAAGELPSYAADDNYKIQKLEEARAKAHHQPQQCPLPADANLSFNPESDE